MKTLLTFFGWPDGGVWPNEVANLFWIPIAASGGWFLQKVFKKHIDKRHNELMTHVSKIHDHLGIKE